MADPTKFHELFHARRIYPEDPEWRCPIHYHGGWEPEDEYGITRSTHCPEILAGNPPCGKKEPSE